VVLDAASALPVAEVTDAFLTSLTGPAPAAPMPRSSGRVSPQAGAPDLTVVPADVDDPVLAPLLHELKVEYSTRYGGPSPYTTLTEVPASDFTGPGGAFLALTEDGETIAGGALRRYDHRTAEVKRVWTSYRHRRRGLARRLMAELEKAAAELGYRRIHLTTGGRQPEAVALYLAAGYLPRFDLTAELGDRGPLAFGKELVPGAGLVEWDLLPTPENHAPASMPEPATVGAG
jgi:GNAT superfamily N-acetyltransferase